MKLLRLATVYLDPAPPRWRSARITLGSTELITMGSWDLDSGVRLLVVAIVPLSDLPPVARDGLVMVPEEPRRQAEQAIKAYANFIATLARVSRRIASPSPYVAFLPETDDEWVWLESTKGLKAGFSAVPGSRPPIERTDELMRGLADRLDGLELCAEAQSQLTAVAKFREFVRVFERAFAEGTMKRLVEPLALFLQENGQGFTQAEVNDWLHKKRHSVTHAGERGPYLLDSDIAPIIQRVEQAAYDLLFNKAEWRSPSVERRNLWSPVAGTSDAGSSVFITKGKKITLQFQVTDRLGGFRADLSTSLTTIPKEWWVGVPDKATQGDDAVSQLEPDNSCHRGTGEPPP